MTREVTWTPTGRRSLNRLPPKIVASVVEFAYGALAENPEQVGKPLVLEFKGLWAARRGDYRIVYWFDEESIVIDLVAHRGDVYRRR